MDNDDFNEILNDYVMDGFEIMKQFRGNIIEKGIQIDSLLEDIISNYFSKENKIKNNEFRNLILDSRFITTFRKIKIFQELKLHKNPIFKEKYDGFSGRLIHFNEARDDIAHITRETYHHEFKMRWKGKKENYVLNEKFMKEIEDEYQDIIRILHQIAAKSNLLLNWNKYK